MMTRTLLPILLFTPLLAAQLPAQSDAADHVLIQQLMDRVGQLVDRVGQLESEVRQLRGPAAAPAATAAVSATPAQPQTPALTPAAAMAQEMAESGGMNMSLAGLPRLQMQGFSDIRYGLTGQKGVASTFTLGQVNLFMTSKLAEHFNAISEMVVQADATNTFTIRMSRLLFEYNANDYFNLSAGRYHTSIGFYNTAFHHSTWLQNGFDRPFLFAFEDVGGILPIHGIGLTASGTIPSGGLGLHYAAELSNGRTSRSPLLKATQSQQDENNGKAVNFAIFARPLALPGFQTGFSVYRDTLHPDVTSFLTPYGRKVGQDIFAGYSVYQGGRLEFLNELVVLRHAVQNGPTYHIPAFYSQVSTPFGKLRPYFRYEYMNVPRNEPMFGDVGLRHGPSIGIRYDFTDFAAFKIEYFRLIQRDIDPFNGMRTQVSFVF